MTRVELSHLIKHFTPGQAAVEDVSLVIPEGKLTALLGPSGCGKTTILKMIAGLLHPSEGDIRFDGQSILRVPTERRGAVMVFQNHLLFPYLNVEDNIAFGLKMSGVPKAEIRHRVDEMLELVQLAGYARRKPAEISGGQQQRVALARALVVHPRVLLLDEPLSNLDAHLREEMRELILRLQRQKEITTVFVTHDQEEATVLADQIALFFEGVLQQVDRPQVFFKQPANLQVARFFGAKNFIPGVANGNVVDTPIGKFQMQGDHPLQGPIHLVIRPEHIQIVSEQNAESNIVEGIVQSIVFTGISTRLKISKDSQTLEVTTSHDAVIYHREGDRILLCLPAEKFCVCMDNMKDE